MSAIVARALAARAGARLPRAAPAFAAYATTASNKKLDRAAAAVRSEVTITPLYTAEVTATGGRNGRATSSNKALDVELTFPKALGGPGVEGRTDPEQLFAAAYAACFQGAMGLAAQGFKIKLPESTTVTAQVGIGKYPEEGFGLAVELRISAPGVSDDSLTSVILEAHELCPYSRAIRHNVNVKLTIV
ncbi:hypothetical protein H4R19_003069 [Coemansia spiralis]|nr:hypothetical protein H4R19_003069 [Coemansia spiralis]